MTVDGVVAELGKRVDVETQVVAVDGAPVGVRPDLVYYLLNKPSTSRPPTIRRVGPLSSMWCPMSRGCSRSGVSMLRLRACWS